MLLCDVVVDGVELDWTVHVPLMLHILFLGMDHTRPLVHQHCKQLLLNLLIVLAQHNDHLTVAHVLLNSKTNELGLGLPTPSLPVLTHTFTGKFVLNVILWFVFDKLHSGGQITHWYVFLFFFFGAGVTLQIIFSVFFVKIM